MTPDEAYEEALRRIREAEETGAVELDLKRMESNRMGVHGTCIINSTSAGVGTPCLARIAQAHGVRAN